MIPGDLLQKLIHAAYLTFDHNQSVIAYLAGFILSTGLAIWKPNRFSILIMIGFAVLGFGFEYDKHLVGPLTRQTLQSIIENPDTHLRTQKYINIFLGEMLPVVFYLLGWGLIFLGLVLGVKNYPNTKVVQPSSSRIESLEE